MKKSIIGLSMALSLASYSQTKTQTKTNQSAGKKKSNVDSVFIAKQVDDMSDKVYYLPSKALVSIDYTKNQGFRLSSFIEGKNDDELSIKDLSLKMVGIGSCVEDNILIIKFADETKIELKSWNDFNCEGDAWFTIDSEQASSLSSKKIVKVKVQNGRSFESFTTDIPEIDSDYFIQLFYAVQNKKIKKVK